MDIEEHGWSMAGKRHFTFNFDEKKTLLIRNTIDEHAVFATQAEYMAKVAEERGKNGFRTTRKPLWVYDAVYASLSRVEDTLHYINSLDLPSEGSSKQRSAFDFFDFINNMYVVIECIKTLGHIFGVSSDRYKEIEKSTDCFQQLGLTGNGSDDDFFEYVRSLVAVHPVETGRHPEYHGYGKIHYSPFAVWSSELWMEEFDISVHIYTSERNGDIEILHLRINQFEKYLQKWIDFIDVIVDAIIDFNNEKMLDYINMPIKEESGFATYDKYVENLRTELIARVGEYTDYILENYTKLFAMSLTNQNNEHKFSLYKNAIKYSLKFLHARLQNMDNDEISNTGITYPDPNLETHLYIELWKPRCRNSEISTYGYELEKMYYLDDSGSFNERYARDLLEKIKPIINKYVVFTNTESAFETQVLVSMALYFECLGYQNIVNRNIPNSLEYRESLVNDAEWELLIKNEQPKRKEENRFHKFLKETNE